MASADIFQRDKTSGVGVAALGFPWQLAQCSSNTTAPFVVWACEEAAGQSIAVRIAKIQADRFMRGISRAEYFIVYFLLRDNIRPPAPTHNALHFRRRQIRPITISMDSGAAMPFTKFVKDRSPKI
jgi:hypothetical protein